MLFGKDTDAFQHGLGGLFSLGVQLAERLAAVLEIHYSSFAQRGVVPGRLELLTLAGGVRYALPLRERLTLRFGGGLGFATFGVRSLTDTGAFALTARVDLSIRLARTLSLDAGVSPGVAMSPSAGQSFYLPIRAGLSFLF